MPGIPLSTVIAAFFIAANGTAFFLFLSDKRRARRDSWRISEGTLLFSAALGPFGSFTAMHLFHHKTKKGKFLLVPVFLALQIALTGLILFFR